MGTQFRHRLSKNDKKRIQNVLVEVVDKRATDAKSSERWETLRPKVKKIVAKKTPEAPKHPVTQSDLDKVRDDPVLEQIVISGVVDIAYRHHLIGELPKSRSLCVVLRWLGELYQRASDVKDFVASVEELVDELNEELAEPDPFEVIVKKAGVRVLTELKTRGANSGRAEEPPAAGGTAGTACRASCD